MTNYEQWCEKNSINQITRALLKTWMMESTGGHHSNVTGMSDHIYANLYSDYLETFKHDLMQNEDSEIK